MIALLALLTLLADPVPIVIPPPRGQVVILRPERGSRALEESSTRLQAELRASGFTVRVLGRHPDRRVLAYDAGAVMKLDPRPLAAVTIDEADGALIAALWRISPTNARPEAYRVAVKDDDRAGRDGAAPPSVLALRTVELLHASLTGVELDAPRVFPPPPPPPPAAARAPEPAIAAPAPPPPLDADRRAGVLLTAGPVLLGAASGLGPSAAVGVGLGYGRARGPSVWLELVGLGGKARVEADQGRADLAQELALGRLVWTFGGSRVRPSAFFGGGLYRAQVKGAADPDDPRAQSDRGTLVAAVVDAGAGASVRLAGGLSLSLQGSLLFSEPALVVRIAGAEVGKTGRPAAMLTLRLQARL